METEGKWIKMVDLYNFVALHRTNVLCSVALILVNFWGFSMFSEYSSQSLNHFAKILRSSNLLWQGFLRPWSTYLNNFLSEIYNSKHFGENTCV